MRSGSHHGGESSQSGARKARASRLSLRGFARLIGVSHGAVRKAIKAGRLSKSLVKTGVRGAYVIDAELGTTEWARSSRTGAGVGTGHIGNGSHAEPNGSHSTPDGSHLEPPEVLALQDALHPGEPLSASTLIEAQRIATLERARKLRMENEVAQGRLVPADVAAKEAFEAARIIREAMLNVPARIAGELAAETDPARVQLRLEAALREALAATADLLVTVNG